MQSIIPRKFEMKDDISTKHRFFLRDINKKQLKAKFAIVIMRIIHVYGKSSGSISLQSRLLAMNVLIVQNHPAEDLAAFEAHLRKHNLNYIIHNAYKNKTFPALNDCDAFIVGGTPISIYEPTKPQWLKQEISFLTEAVANGKPYLGVCGGGQILATILGAKVKQNPVKEVGGYPTNQGENSPPSQNTIPPEKRSTPKIAPKRPGATTQHRT